VEVVGFLLVMGLAAYLNSEVMIPQRLQNPEDDRLALVVVEFYAPITSGP